MSSHADELVSDAPTPTAPRRSPAVPTDCGDLDGPIDRRRAVADLIAAYDGATYRLLTDLAQALETSVAYVDRLTVEAHVERLLSDTDWSAIASSFTAMAFDEHIGDAGTVRTDWIDNMLLRAGVPGRGPGVSRPSRSIGQSRWR